MLIKVTEFAERHFDKKFGGTKDVDIYITNHDIAIEITTRQFNDDEVVDDVKLMKAIKGAEKHLTDKIKLSGLITHKICA